MTKAEFMEEFRMTFAKHQVDGMEDILEVFEEHFNLGYEQGLTDSAIIAALGTPREIYQSYVEEGIIKEKQDSPTKKIDRNKMNEKFAYYKSLVMPQVPVVAKTASKTLLLASSWLAYGMGILVWVITPALLYLLSISWQPFANIPPLPTISPVTLAGLGGTGFFGGLTCLFIGDELRRFKDRMFTEKGELI